MGEVLEESICIKNGGINVDLLVSSTIANYPKDSKSVANFRERAPKPGQLKNRDATSCLLGAPGIKQPPPRGGVLN